jgi:hypothetical protein
MAIRYVSIKSDIMTDYVFLGSLSTPLALRAFISPIQGRDSHRELAWKFLDFREN